MERFLESQKRIDTHWIDLWAKILEWWKTQHRYSTIRDLAEDIGWDVWDLIDHFQNKEMPPKLVVEKIAITAGLGVPVSDLTLQEATRKTGKSKISSIVFRGRTGVVSRRFERNPRYFTRRVRSWRYWIHFKPSYHAGRRR